MKTEDNKPQISMLSAEEVATELGKAKNIDYIFGKEGILSRPFAKTLEQMMEAELSDQLGYEKNKSKVRNSGNNRNGYYERNINTWTGGMAIQVP